MQLGDCCESCAHGGACEGAQLGDLDYDAVPFDQYNNAQQPMKWNKYPPASPFVYGNSTGRGGATQLRYAQTPQGSSAMMGDPQTGSGQLWQRQLGQLAQAPNVGHAPPCAEEGEQELFGWCFPETLPTAPPGTAPPQLPGVMTEEQCAAREKLAFDKGRSEERANIVTTAAITAVVSGLVGVGIGYIFRR